VLFNRSFTLESDLTADEILTRIAGRTRAISPLYAWTLASIHASLESSGSLDSFVGQVTNEGFRVARATFRGVRPIISGSLAALGSHTLVTVHVGYDLSGTLALVAFTLFPFVCTLLLAQAFPFFLLFAGAIVVAGGLLLASHLVVLSDEQRFRGTLRHLLGGD